MLSLNRSIQRLDEAEASQLAAARELSSAAEAAAKYAIEVDPREAARFREHLRNLAERLNQQPNAGELEAARGAFQSGLRDYASRAAEDVRRMKQDLTAAAEAMQSFAQGISTGAHDHENLLQREFGNLTRTADNGDATALRAAVHDTVAAVTASYQELRQAHNLVIAQLRDEIRTLQQAVEGQPKSSAQPGVLDKQAIDRTIEEKLHARQPFHLLLARPLVPAGAVPAAVRNHAQVEFVKGLRSLEAAAWAAWPPHGYAAILHAAPRDLDFWNQQLSACHLYQQGGLPRTLRIEPRLAVIEFSSSDSPSLFFDRLTQATQNLDS